ncbi:ribosomal RNA-processing protein 17 [Pyrus x bretschneideri]|uniref:ribosomal RNA-processing protein 17 n=1 Tax=Pyrus x bretschneideri TaxID=225117 RepID=UPI00202E011C|nr:ribosomal RNA-processing protein 17 [Pyrus x bretschneideri]
MAAGKVEEAAIPSVNPRSRYIKKRALKNKALAVTFNEKDLSDFVSVFHKRKKKRRKEAEQKQGEALRRKRLELRKQELVLSGGIAQATDTAADEVDEGVEEHEDDEISTTTYDKGEMKVTVTTHDIFREEESDRDEKTEAAVPESVGASEQHNVPVRKTKPPKKAARRKSRPKLQRKRDKRKGIKPTKNKR